MTRMCFSFAALAACSIAVSQSFDPAKTANYKAFAKKVPMTKEHLAMLNKNQFVVAPAPGMTEMGYVFDQNDYEDLPSIVTIDAPIHLYHILFDATLRTTETSALLPRAKGLAKHMIAATKKAYDEATDPALKQAHLYNLAYFGVADRAFGGNTELPVEAQKLVDQEVANIDAHSGYKVATIFPYEIDYTQFIVRGHYTRTEELGKYFKGMMWFGLAPFAMCPPGEIQPDEELTLRALALAQVYAASKADPMWRAIYEPTTLFAGKVNSLTPGMIEAARVKVMPTAALSDSTKYNALCEELFRVNPSLYKPQIGGRSDQPATGLQLRFMPQRGLLDGFAISKVTAAIERPLPSGLDVMAVMGSTRAAQILDASPNLYNPNGWNEYLTNRKDVTTYFAQIPAATWKDNLYNAWLDTLRQTVATPPHAVADFMKTQAFKDKNLNCALASYAELRHDTILYGEQTAVEMGDGEEEQPFVRHYVEPNAPVYERLIWMTRAMRDGLSKYKLLSADSMEDLARFGTLIAFLKSCVDKEIAGQPLSKEAHLRIRKIGGDIDYLTTDLLMRGTNFQTLTANDRDMALVADIHTADPLAFTIASGHAEDIIAIVPIEGKRYLARGPVYSYYEFTVPIAERMTDDEWKKHLAEGKQPARPEWTKSYRVDKPAREVADQQ